MSSVFTSTYHDTPDGRFARTGIALRRRVEKGLSIWEVELPEAPGEVAFSEPGGPAEPPPLVADLLRGLLRERELVEVASLQTRRSEEDASAAEVHDEVEVLEDRHVVERFDVEGEPQDPGLRVVRRRERGKTPGGQRSALPDLRKMIRRQYDEILAHDPGTRLGSDPEALHKLRVAVRRLRAVRRSVRRLADSEFRKLERAMEALGAEPSNTELHRVRVRGKRARYAGELAEASAGEKARRFVARAKRLQDVLGEHQDAVVADERLRELVLSQTNPQFALVAGRLVERQRERMLRARAQAPKTLKQLRWAGRKAWR